MKITLTGINFVFANGFNEDFTGVNLNFVSSGATFNLSGYVEVTKEQYLNAAASPEQTKELIKQEVLNQLQKEPEAV